MGKWAVQRQAVSLEVLARQIIAASFNAVVADHRYQSLECPGPSFHVMCIHIQALRQIPNAYLTGKVQEPTSSCCPPLLHLFPKSQYLKWCTGTPEMYLDRWSDNAAAGRVCLVDKFWRWPSVSVLYLPVVETVFLSGPSCLVERGSILTVFFCKLAPWVLCCLKVTFCIMMGWENLKHLETWEHLEKHFSLSLLRRNRVTWQNNRDKYFDSGDVVNAMHYKYSQKCVLLSTWSGWWTLSLPDICYLIQNKESMLWI